MGERSPRARVLRLLQGAQAAGLFPGAVVGWRERDGSLHTVEVGRAVIAPRPISATASTVYDLASLTKPLVTTTLLLLGRRSGKFELTSRLGELVPEVHQSWLSDLRLDQLMTHTAGLPAWYPIYWTTRPDSWVSELARGLCGPMDEKDVVYSCPGFLLLGAVLERSLGMDLAEAFRTLVAEPMGLQDDLWMWGAEEVEKNVFLRGRLAGGAASSRVERELLAERGLDVVPPDGNRPDDGNARFLRGSAGNAGLFGTVKAVLELAAEFREGGGLLLSSDEARLATRNWTPGLQQARGLGWQLAATPGCSAGAAWSPAAFGHTGFTGPSVWVEPSSGICVALLTNRHHPDHRGTDLHPLRRRLHRIVLEGLPSRLRSSQLSAD